MAWKTLKQTCFRVFIALEVPDVRALHPQGAARFEVGFVGKRLTRHLKRNPMTDGVHPAAEHPSD